MSNEGSRSDTQGELEKSIIALLSAELSSQMATAIHIDGSEAWSTVAESLNLDPAWKKAQPDGCFWDGQRTLILVECFARADQPKPGQVGKVAKDSLKLATIKKIVEQRKPKGHIKVRCIIVMPCVIERFFKNDGWLSAAFSEHGVEIIGVKLSDSLLGELKAAQQRQAANMAQVKSLE